ncbi:MAG: hypothetical protein M3R15_16100 [Acidobacteriota bacterium]|nr:hypothetical protein [Acidobacteriota bacterium]
MKNKPTPPLRDMHEHNSRHTDFAHNAFYERVLALRATDQRAFDSLAPATKQALYAYETAKREHSRLEAIRDEPEAA